MFVFNRSEKKETSISELTFFFEQDGITQADFFNHALRDYERVSK